MSNTPNPIREYNENLIKDFSKRAIIVEIFPALNTHLGVINMLGKDSSLIQDISGDWVCVGHLSELNDNEFDSLFTRVQDYASQMLKSFCSS